MIPSQHWACMSEVHEEHFKAQLAPCLQNLENAYVPE